VGTDSLGNKYFENYNPYEEVPGEYLAFEHHLKAKVDAAGEDLMNSLSVYPGDRLYTGRQRWVDYSQVSDHTCPSPRLRGCGRFCKIAHLISSMAPLFLRSEQDDFNASRE